jgi:hypothetical protein
MDNIQEATTDLSTKERFDSWMRLAEFRRDVRKTRIDNSMKVTLGYWAVFVATIATVAGKELPATTVWKLFFFLMLFSALFSYAWSRPTYRVNEEDRIASERFRFKAESIVSSQPETVRLWRIGLFTHLRHYTHRAEFIGGFALSVLVLIAGRAV